MAGGRGFRFAQEPKLRDSLTHLCMSERVKGWLAKLARGRRSHPSSPLRTSSSGLCPDEDGIRVGGLRSCYIYIYMRVTYELR